MLCVKQVCKRTLYQVLLVSGDELTLHCIECGGFFLKIGLLARLRETKMMTSTGLYMCSFKERVRCYWFLTIAGSIYHNIPTSVYGGFSL